MNDKRADNNTTIEMRDLSKDYASAEDYIEKVLKGNSVSRAMTEEALLVFEALCYKIFEQKESREAVMVTGFRQMGDTSIEITYEGVRFDPDPADPTDITPEDRVLRAYADKIDYSYRSGSNRIMITSKRSHLMSIGIYAASIAIGIAVYTILQNTTSGEIQYYIAEKIVFPLEKLFMNATLMVGAPVTFLSLLKHLTDTYIIAGSHSNARKLHRSTITSSIVSVGLAIVSSWLLTMLLFSGDMLNGKYSHSVLDMNPEDMIPSLMPSDIFTPFMTVAPYPLIILAVLTTYSFCSVGKYFDRMKEAIDVAYVLFARMLAVLMYALPFFAIMAVLDELLSDGYKMLFYLAELIVVVFASLSILLCYYMIRLARKGIRPLPFLRKMVPLLRENAKIASAFDAVPFNIRYCTRNFGFDRKRLEKSMPVLAQINLDGNCFLITMIAMLYIAINSTPLSIGDAVVTGLLVMLLSLGAPNQPGSCLVALAIVMIFLHAEDLGTIAIFGEAVFGGILNLTNIEGDIVTVATEEVRATGSADKLNEITSH